MAPIAVGEKIPDGTLAHFDAEDKLQQVSVHSLASGKKVILFGVPGAFTPTCRYLLQIRYLPQIRCCSLSAIFDQMDG